MVAYALNEETVTVIYEITYVLSKLGLLDIPASGIIYRWDT